MYIGLWLEGKKMGSSKDHFCNLHVSLPGSRKNIREYLCENEIFFKNNLGYAQGPWNYRFMQKTRHQKSHASVPLSTKLPVGSGTAPYLPTGTGYIINKENWLNNKIYVKMEFQIKIKLKIIIKIFMKA